MRTSLAALTMMVAVLPACGAAESEARDAFREGAVALCVANSERAAPPAMAGFDWQRLCGCATDRVMDGRSLRELAGLTPGGPEQRDALARCVQAQIGGGTGAAPALPSGTTG